MNKRVVIYICFLGFILRAIYILFFNSNIVFPDEERFWKESLSLLSNFSYEANGKYAHDMPLTAWFISIASIITGGSIVGVKLFLAAVSALTIYLVSSLAYEIYPSKVAAVLAALISSLYPFFIYFSSLLLSETLFLFFVTLLFLQLLRGDRCSNWRNGVVIGLSHLTRPTLTYFLPIIFLWQYFVLRLSKKKIIISVVLIVLIVFPWGIRNYITLGQFHLSTSGSGQALWEGNNPWNTSGGVSGDFSSPHAYLEEVPDGLSELSEDEWKKVKAVEYIASEPMSFVRLSVKKFFRFWHLWPNSFDHQELKYKLASFFSFGFILIFSILGVYLFRKDYRRLSILYIFVAYYTLLHMVTIGSIRYRLPLDPLLIALASAAIARLVSIKYGEKFR